MKEKKDIIDILFDKKVDDDEFNMQDNLLKHYRHQLCEASNNLYNFINTQIPSENRNELKLLISNRDDALADYHYRENQLFYKNGIIDILYLKFLNPNNT